MKHGYIHGLKYWLEGMGSSCAGQTGLRLKKGAAMKKASFLIMFLFVTAVAVPGLCAEEKKWSDEGELAFVKTGGNTEVTNLAAKNLVKYQFSEKVLGSWKLGSLYAETDKVKTAQSYFTDLNVHYQSTEKMYYLAGAGWQQNKFSGIDRSLYGGLGAGYKFLDGPAHFLIGELGLRYVSDKYTDETGNNYAAGRGFGKYTYAFTEKNRASQSVELLYNFSNSKRYAVNSETAVISALSGNLSLKAAYVVNYQNEPIPSTFEKTDTMLTVALVVNY
jgi:putative salt-induced outer membrane protein YdiY